MNAMYPDGYTPPILTVDCVIFQFIGNVLNVLLLQRAKEPFKDMWALPGGYNAAGETTGEAMRRILGTKTGLDTKTLRYLEQLYTFDTVARDPRGHAVSVSYLGLGRDLQLTAGETAQNPRFFPVSALPDLAYDHQEIIAYALERLRAKIMYTNAIFGLLPDTFTLTQLQTAYEGVLGRPLDKRNFRKKFLSLGLIEATDNLHRDGAHRPARLYRFRTATLEALERSFD